MRKNGKAAAVCRRVFSGLCFLLAVAYSWAYFSFFTEMRAGEDLAPLGMLLFAFYGGIAIVLLAVPFVLLLVYCRKPLLPVIAYASVVLWEIGCLIVSLPYA